MKQLPLPAADPLAHFDAIAAVKRKGRATRLTALRPKIEALYGDYSRCAPDLASLPEQLAATLSTIDRDDLLRCYTVTTCAPRSALVARIFQVTQLCPYCGINQVHTLDHYLPKIGHEQYAIFPPNIIPSCGDCNTRRGERWQDAGRRTTLHFYFDPIDEDAPLLSARLLPENGEYTAEYSIASHPGAVTSFPAQYRRHCETLGLVSTAAAETPRFKRASIGRLKDVMEDIRNLQAVAPAFDVTDHYARKARTFTAAHGANHWETALYRAIATSPEFIRASIERAARLNAAGGRP